MKKKRCMLMGLVLLATGVPAFGGDAVHEMDQIVVTAGRIEEKKADVTTNITVITGEDIEKSAARDLGQLLSEQGLPIRKYPGSLTAVSVRGFRTETHGNDLAGHVLILIDGRRAGNGNVSQLLVDNVERVEIIRGPGSVQYGSSAMGGVINVITKKGSGRPTFFVEETLGSFEYQKTSLGGSGSLGPVDLSFSASRESQDAYTTAKNIMYHNTGIDREDRISAGLGWTFLPGHRVSFTYTGFDGEGIGLPDDLASNDLNNYKDSEHSTMDLNYQGRLASDALAWQIRLYEGKTRRTDYDPDVSGSTPDYSLRSDQQGAQAQVTASRAKDHLTLGIDWVNYEVRSIYDTQDNSYDNPAAFVMAKKSLLDDRLILSVGGRYDDYEVKDGQGQSVDDTHWSSSAGASFKIGKALVARFNVAESFRMPTTDELYMYRDYGAWGIWSGNPDLSPEKSRTWETGLDVKTGPFSASATYFYSTFDDYITYEEGLPGQYTYANLDGATLSGLETTLSWDLGETLTWESTFRPFMSLTFLTDYTDEQNDRDLQYTSEWTLAGGIEYIHLESGLSSRFNVSYFSEQDINDYNGTGDTTLDSYAVADLSIAKDLLDWGKQGKLSIKGDIQNLFNQNYAAVQGYPMPGRALFISLKYTY